MYQLVTRAKERIYNIINQQFGPDGATEALLTSLSYRLADVPQGGRGADAFPYAALETTNLSGRITTGDLVVQPSHTLYQATYTLTVLDIAADPQALEAQTLNILGTIARYFYRTYGDVESLLPATDTGFLSSWQIGRARPVQNITRESRENVAHIAAWALDFNLWINEPY